MRKQIIILDASIERKKLFNTGVVGVLLLGCLVLGVVYNVISSHAAAAANPSITLSNTSIVEGRPVGYFIGAINYSSFGGLSADNPYSIDCSVPGADDSFFKLEQFFSNYPEILKNKVVFDYDEPLDQNGDNIYEVCIKVVDDQGNETDNTFDISVLEIIAPVITSARLEQLQNGKKILTIGGALAYDTASQYEIKFNGTRLPVCTDNTGLTVDELENVLGETDSYGGVSSGAPCYYNYSHPDRVGQDYGDPSLTNERTVLLLPSTFKLTKTGTVQINGSNVFNYGSLQVKPGVPSVVKDDGNKRPNVQTPTIIATQPVISDMATPSKEVDAGNTATGTVVTNDPDQETPNTEFLQVQLEKNEEKNLPKIYMVALAGFAMAATAASMLFLWKRH